MKTKRLKNSLTFLTAVVLSIHVAWAETAPVATPSTEPSQCPANLEDYAPAIDAAAAEGNFYDGSNLFNSCQRLARGYLPKFYSGHNDEQFWKKYATYECCKKSDKEVAKCVAQKMETAKSCEAVAYIIKQYDRDWTNQEHFKKTSASQSGQMQGAQQGQNGSAASVASAASSFKCVSDGLETVDYESCIEFKNKLETINVVQQVGYATQELVYQDKISDSELKNMGEENTAVGTLKTQGDSLKMQGDMYNQRTAVDATKLAYLYSIYNDMPDNKEVLAKCKGLSSNSSRGIQGPDKVKSCELSVAKGHFSFLMNQKNRDAMKAKLIEIAASAGSNAILANLMNKRSGDIDSAIAKIEDYKPVDPYTITEDEALANYCSLNPTAAACKTGDLERTIDMIGDNIINFGDGGTGTVYRDRETDPGTNALAQTGNTVDRKSVEAIGSVVTPSSGDDSIERSTAATVKDGPTGSSGGGGGGSVSGGGGGGGGDSAGQGAAAQTIASASAPANYEGGGGFSVMGGAGINRKKAEGDNGENPFSKLFGKENNPSSLVNFREPASMGKKGDNIFDMISKRYTKVSGDKRLLEYELAK